MLTQALPLELEHFRRSLDCFWTLIYLRTFTVLELSLCVTVYSYAKHIEFIRFQDSFALNFRLKI